MPRKPTGKGTGQGRTPRATARKPERTYRIFYGELMPSQLSSRVLVLNHPGYGNPIGPHGSRELTPKQPHANQLEQETGFYSRLKASMEKDGCINPIHALSIEEGTFCRYGTSRLWTAKGLDIPVKVIITDWVDRWTELEELFTEEDIRAKFVNQPEILELGTDMMRIDKCPHSHLDPPPERTISYSKLLGR